MSAAASVDVAKPPAIPARSPWIVAPTADLTLVILTPIALWGILSAAQWVWSPADITSFALVWAIGHHLPGMMRAYGDRRLFERFKVRFLVAPLILVAIGIYSLVVKSSAIPLAVGQWGWWHYLMQAYGFIRIYDAKAGSVDPLTCRLDQAMCLAWFAAPLAFTPNSLFNDLHLFYRAGGPVIAPPIVWGLQACVGGVLIVVTTWFLIHTVRQTRQGRPPSRLKLILMATNFGYYWYCLATASNLLISYALYELFHDIQYLTIVWAFNQRRAERDPGAGGFTRFLFRQRWWLIAFYLALIIGYGLMNTAAQAVPDGSLQNVLLGLFVASTLLHYYYDGFIWKLRESETRNSLGLSDLPASRTFWRPNWTWGLLAIPFCGALWLIVQERRAVGRGDTGGSMAYSIDKHDALAAALPNSVFAHFYRGLALADIDRLEEAQAEFQLAQSLNPYYSEATFRLGDSFQRRGKIEEAKAQYQKMLQFDSRHAEANFRLGAMAFQRGRLREALAYFDVAVRRSPQSAEIHGNYGLTLLALGKSDLARKHLQRALELDPDLAEAYVGLAQVEQLRGQFEPALVHARRAAELQPESASAHYNLGVVLHRMQRLDEAVAAYRRAIDLNPNKSTYWNNLGVALEHQQQIEKALEAFRQAAALAPQDEIARKNLSRLDSLIDSASR